MAKFIYKDQGSQEFTLLEHYIVAADSEDQDWVRYQNTRTHEIYTCRLAAFEYRFQRVHADD